MKEYIALEIQLVTLSARDVVTTSGFYGDSHSFGNPNESDFNQG